MTGDNTIRKADAADDDGHRGADPWADVPVDAEAPPSPVKESEPLPPARGVVDSAAYLGKVPDTFTIPTATFGGEDHSQKYARDPVGNPPPAQIRGRAEVRKERIHLQDAATIILNARMGQMEMPEIFERARILIEKRSAPAYSRDTGKQVGHFWYDNTASKRNALIQCMDLQYPGLVEAVREQARTLNIEQNVEPSAVARKKFAAEGMKALMERFPGCLEVDIFDPRVPSEPTAKTFVPLHTSRLSRMKDVVKGHLASVGEKAADMAVHIGSHKFVEDLAPLADSPPEKGPWR